MRTEIWEKLYGSKHWGRFCEFIICRPGFHQSLLGDHLKEDELMKAHRVHGRNGNVYKILVERSEWERQHGRLTH
jgi:hypothetical protein